MTVAGSAPLVVASNRGPISIVPVEDGDDEIRRGGGGLVSGMQAALAATPDAVWICAALNDRERSLARRAVSGRLSEVPAGRRRAQGRLRRQDAADRCADVPAGLQRQSPTRRCGSCCTCSTSCRAVPGLRRQLATVHGPATCGTTGPSPRRSPAEAAEGATVMVQDYHLFLVPRLLRDLRPDVRIGLFTHTPWVPPEYFHTLPTTSRKTSRRLARR